VKGDRGASEERGEAQVINWMGNKLRENAKIAHQNHPKTIQNKQWQGKRLNVGDGRNYKGLEDT